MKKPKAPTTAPHHRFRWAFFSIALLAGTGGHWLALASLDVLAHHEKPPWLILPSLIASLALARLYHLLRQRNRWPRNWRQAFPQVALAWAVFVTALWFAVTSEALLHGWLDNLGWGDPSILLAILGFFLLALSLPVYERLQEDIQGIHDLALRQDKTHEDAEAMILFLSTPTILPEVCEDGEDVHARVRFAEGAVATLHGTSLPDDIKAVSASKPARARPWNWQQLLRAVESHRSLDQLWLIGSADADNYVPPGELKVLPPSKWPAGFELDPNSGKGSADFAPRCRRLLQPYTKARIRICDRPVCFDRYEDTMTVARDVLKEVLRSVPAHRVTVDVTGGTKITSIVGATLTLNRGTTFQYVDTQYPHDVIPFLLAPEEPPGAHGH